MKHFKFGDKVMYRKHRAIVLKTDYRQNIVEIAEQIRRFTDIGWTSINNVKRGWEK